MREPIAWMLVGFLTCLSLMLCGYKIPAGPNQTTFFPGPISVNGDATISGNIAATRSMSAESLQASTIFRARQCAVIDHTLLVGDSSRFNKGFYAGAQYIAKVDAFTYDPTRSAEVNLDANVSVTTAQYVRIGNTVTVSGRFTADPTVTATTTSFELTLPVASNFGNAQQAAGVAFCGSIVSQGAEVIADPATDTVKIQWKSSDVTSQTWSYTYTYRII